MLPSQDNTIKGKFSSQHCYYYIVFNFNLLGLLQVIWETFISQILVVEDPVNANASVTLSVDWVPMSR